MNCDMSLQQGRSLTWIIRDRRQPKIRQAMNQNSRGNCRHPCSLHRHHYLANVENPASLLLSQWSSTGAVWKVCIISEVRHAIGWLLETDSELLWTSCEVCPSLLPGQGPLSIFLWDGPRSWQARIHLCMGLTFPIMSSRHNHWPKTNSTKCSQLLIFSWK